jgi:glutamate--cysteine ligase
VFLHPPSPNGPDLDGETPISPASGEIFVDHLRAGAKPREEWALGMELELIGYTRDGRERVSGDQLPSLLNAYAEEEGAAIEEDGAIIGARSERGLLSLEPGGQLEFSGRPHRHLRDLESELRDWLDWLGAQSEERGLFFVGCGFDPLCALERQQWVPKRRYRIMRPYLATRGARAWDMMTRTAAVQVNLDYSSEADLGRKFILANRLAPIATALFANSPFREGRLTGFKSERARVWLETDPDRSGISPVALDDRFSLEAFVDYLLEVPMIFTRRGVEYLDCSGLPFGEYLARGSAPVLRDFTDHLTTIFTEGRIKQWVEVRGADAVGPEECLALHAFWKGLLYDEAAAAEALRLAPRLGLEGFRELQRAVAREALAARAGGIEVMALARECVALARAGLARAAPSETRYLDPLLARLDDGWAPADRLIGNFEGAWHGRIERALEYLRVA